MTMDKDKLKRKYLKYVDDCIGHGDSNYASYQEWLEQTVIDLANENSFLCPAGDFDVITTLKAEKLYMMEEVSRLNQAFESLQYRYDKYKETALLRIKDLESDIDRLELFCEQKDEAFDMLMDHAGTIEYERDNLIRILRKVGVNEEQKGKLMLEVQQVDMEDE